MTVTELSEPEYRKLFDAYDWEAAGVKIPWYSRPRGFWEYPDKIYINKDAFFFSPAEKELLIAHEQGHAAGLEHTTFGLMSENALFRYITASTEGIIVFGLFILFIVFVIVYLRRR